MASTAPSAMDMIKTEDSTSPDPSLTFLEPAPACIEAPAPDDVNDPEDFLRRCSGSNKKTKQRCSSVIGKKAQKNTRPTYLPTCSTHRDQQSFAGRCHFQHANGKECGRLFRWFPPYLELCSHHEGQSDTPCFLFNLPLELRHEIFRYLLPTKPISSSTASLHDGTVDMPDAPHVESPFPSSSARAGLHLSYLTHAAPLPPFSRSTLASVFPMPLLDLLLVNRQMYHEAKDLLYSVAAFTIDVRKDGTFMCGRRLLEPRRPDGSSHFVADESVGAKDRFLKAFDWAAVKNYSVDILLENWSGPAAAMDSITWDEEVEIYDIRDYVSVVVSGILAKSRNLCKLQVRLCLADFKWSEDQIMTNTKLIVSPFERLRNVRQPCLAGVYKGRPYHNSTLCIRRPKHHVIKGLLKPPQIFSVPPLPTQNRELKPGMPVFDDYTAVWTRSMSSSSPAPVTKKPPIREMFTEFKDFYSKLSRLVPDLICKNGRCAFLHRARVAREQEDVPSFRHLRNELIDYWYLYLEMQELKKTEVHASLSKMLDADIYPLHEVEKPTSPLTGGHHCRNPSSSPSPVLLNADSMAKEGIPMTGNPRPMGYLPHQQQYMHMMVRQQQQRQQYRAMLMSQNQAALRQNQNQHLQRVAQTQAQARQVAQIQQVQQTAVQAGDNVAMRTTPQFCTPGRYTQVLGSSSNLNANTNGNFDLCANPNPPSSSTWNSTTNSFSSPISPSSSSSPYSPLTAISPTSPSANDPDPGPSRKKARIRVDSGCEEEELPDLLENRDHHDHHQDFNIAQLDEGGGEGVEGEVLFYTGKGKGKVNEMMVGAEGRRGVGAVGVGFVSGD